MEKIIQKNEKERDTLFNKYKDSALLEGDENENESDSENRNNNNNNDNNNNNNNNNNERGTKHRDSMNNEDYIKYKEMKEEYNEKRRLFNENIKNGCVDWELYLEDEFSKLVFMVSPTGKLWTCCGGGGWFIKGTSNDTKFKNLYQTFDKKVQSFLPCMLWCYVVICIVFFDI